MRNKALLLGLFVAGLAASSFTLTIDKSSKPGKDLGSSANVSFSGKVSVKVRLCGTGTSATLQLRELKVGEHQSEGDQH